ncbi:MAG TPA: hypothetical protein VID68_06795 [Solirubrobacteraceae bacterium]|jgi:hypothetical protein
MTESTDLERRYRRLLAFYPKPFRREREQEVLSVLMEGARAGQRWPRRAEATDLLKHAMAMMFGRPTSHELRHPTPWVLLRVVVGLWLLILTVFLCHIGQWWALALLAPAVLQFYLGYRVAIVVDRERQVGGPPSPPSPA